MKNTRINKIVNDSYNHNSDRGPYSNLFPKLKPDTQACHTNPPRE